GPLTDEAAHDLGPVEVGVPVELGRDDLEPSGGRAQADLDIGGDERVEQAGRIRSAGGARDAKEDVHLPPGGPLAAALGPLRLLEEGGELVVLLVREAREGRHRRTGGHAARALEMVDLELLPAAFGALGGEVGRPEVRRARAEVRVAAQTTRQSEDLSSLLAVGG